MLGCRQDKIIKRVSRTRTEGGEGAIDFSFPSMDVGGKREDNARVAGKRKRERGEMYGGTSIFYRISE